MEMYLSYNEMLFLPLNRRLQIVVAKQQIIVSTTMMSTIRKPSTPHSIQIVAVEEMVGGSRDVLDVVVIESDDGANVDVVVAEAGGGDIEGVMVAEACGGATEDMVVAKAVVVVIISGLQLVTLISNVVESELELQVRLKLVVQSYQVNASVSLVTLHQISNVEELLSHIQSAVYRI